MARFVRRDWGWYLTILDRPHFKVKLLRFLKLKKCSYQTHKKRSELWLFLTGSGRMLMNDLKPSLSVSAGDFISIPVEQKHQFQSLRKTLVLEIQYGEKCIEEDIIRA